MKVYKLQNICGFTPFDVSLTVESEEEARALYAIFNYSPNVALLTFEACKLVRELIGKEYAHLGAGDVIANGITYANFYHHKNKD